MLTGRANAYAALLLAVQVATGCADENQAGDDPAAPAAPASNAAAPAAATRDEKLVLAFGDSLYAGYGVDQKESFPHRLEQALAARGLRAKVHNGGVSGDTSTAGRQRLAFTMDGLPRKPDLVLVGLGGNDMLRGIDPEVTRENLDAILAELRRRGIPVLLTGMVAAHNLGRDYRARFDPIYPELARKYGAGLDPFFLQDVVTRPSLMLPDQIHPNAAGIDKIVARVGPLVASELTK